MQLSWNNKESTDIGCDVQTIFNSMFTRISNLISQLKHVCDLEQSVKTDLLLFIIVAHDDEIDNYKCIQLMPIS